MIMGVQPLVLPQFWKWRADSSLHPLHSLSLWWGTAASCGSLYSWVSGCSSVKVKMGVNQCCGPFILKICVGPKSWPPPIMMWCPSLAICNHITRWKYHFKGVAQDRKKKLFLLETVPHLSIGWVWYCSWSSFKWIWLSSNRWPSSWPSMTFFLILDQPFWQPSFESILGKWKVVMVLIQYFYIRSCGGSRALYIDSE